MRPFRLATSLAALPMLTEVRRAPSSSYSSSSSSTPTAPRGMRPPRDTGISEGLEGIGAYAGTISAFVKPAGEKPPASFGGGPGGGVLPCEQPGSQAALQAAQAEHMATVAMTGKLPAPSHELRDATRLQGPAAHGAARPAPRSSSLPRRAPPASLETAQRRPPSSLAGESAAGEATARLPSSPYASSSSSSSSLPKPASAAAPSPSPSPSSGGATAGGRVTADGARVMRTKEATDYYRSLPQKEVSKEEMWRRINQASADRAEETGPAIALTDVDYLKLEEELREFDTFHYRVGEIAYADADMRRDYYAMWNLAMSLNKARWSMLEVHSQRGMKTTGAGMKLIFWKESVGAIMEKRKMTTGQFTDSHPVLRPFAAAVERNPHMTKAFVRGFTDARLRVIQQPGNVQQLFDHFDKFYGYFFNSLLEVTHVKDEAAEHLMTHIGRANGLTNHCVMFWKKYARLGFTMLPADICADNHVNLGLLKNIPLASRDRAVRKVLFDVMCIVKDEMLHAEKIAKDVPPKAWPIVMECMYPNYYLGFLQRRDFNVSAMFADHNIENAGFTWYRIKKRWEWERYQNIERLISEAAPLPYIHTSFAHRGSQYKMASGTGVTPASPARKRG